MSKPDPVSAGDRLRALVDLVWRDRYDDNCDPVPPWLSGVMDRRGIVQVQGDEWGVLAPDDRSVPRRKPIFDGVEDETASDLPGLASPDLREHGVDVLAWYAPFHFHRKTWGIYVRAYGIEVVAKVLKQNGVPSIFAPQLAYDFLFGHEFGHFQTELLASGITLMVGHTRRYAHAKDAQRIRSPGYGEHEEALCNAIGREFLPKDVRNSLDAWLNGGPIGYRDWSKHRASRRTESWRLVLHELLSGQNSSGLAQVDAVEWFAVPGPPTFLRQVPVYVVMDGSGADGDVALAFQGSISIVESERFQRDIRKQPQLEKLWHRTRAKLEVGVLHAGLHLEKVHAHDRVWSARLSKGSRVALSQVSPGQWEAILADSDHDRFYERVRGLQ